MKISILGCGWYGYPLAVYLQNEGFEVNGSTTTFDKMPLLQKSSVSPFLINFDPDYAGEGLHEFLDTEILLINIPPGSRRNGGDFHLLQMERIVEAISRYSVKKIIYISSTSVYPGIGGIFSEQDIFQPEEAGNKVLFLAEEMVKHIPDTDYVILRFGGLTGYDRMLAKYFAGKNELPMGHCPVNLLHRDDAIKVTHEIILQQKWNNIYNVCAPLHPLRKDFYANLCKIMNLVPPTYKEDDTSPCKIVNSMKLIDELDYNFLYPDPMTFSYERWP